MGCTAARLEDAAPVTDKVVSGSQRNRPEGTGSKRLRPLLLLEGARGRRSVIRDAPTPQTTEWQIDVLLGCSALAPRGGSGE